MNNHGETRLDQQLVDYPARHVGEPEISALMTVGQPLVIQAQAVQESQNK